MYDYNARWYDPEIGRFLQPDSIVPSPFESQSLNRYSYVMNYPVNMVDPSGHAFLLFSTYSWATWAAEADANAGKEFKRQKGGKSPAPGDKGPGDSSEASTATAGTPGDATSAEGIDSPGVKPTPPRNISQDEAEEMRREMEDLSTPELEARVEAAEARANRAALKEAAARHAKLSLETMRPVFHSRLLEQEAQKARNFYRSKKLDAQFEARIGRDVLGGRLGVHRPRGPSAPAGQLSPGVR